MPVDYEALSNTDPLVLARIDAALQEMISASVPVSKAVSLIAISVNEGMAMWGTPRGPAMWYPPTVACVDYRQMVGWESGLLNDPLHIPTGVVNDVETMNYIDSRGGLASSGLSLQAPFFHGLDANNNDSAELARLLEWAIDNRRPAVLQSLALGPLQMDLQFSGLYTGAANKPGFPMTWDDLWNLYNAPDCATFIDQVVYLDPVSTGIATYPADHPDDDATNIKWLQYQTGGSDLSVGGGGYPASYYESGGGQFTMYNGWLWRVISRAVKAGYMAEPA